MMEVLPGQIVRYVICAEYTVMEMVWKPYYHIGYSYHIGIRKNFYWNWYCKPKEVTIFAINGILLENLK